MATHTANSSNTPQVVSGSKMKVPTTIVVKWSLVALLVGAFVLPSHAYADSPQIWAGQGVVSATSTYHGSSAAQVYTYYLGNGYTASTTSAVAAAKIVGGTGIQEYRIDVVTYSDSGYSSSVGTCTYDNGTAIGTVDGFVNLSHLFQSLGQGCVVTPADYVAVIITANDTTGTFGNQIQYTYGSPVKNRGWASCFNGNPVTSCNETSFFAYFSLIGNGWSLTASSSESGWDLSGSTAYCNSLFASSTGIGYDIMNGLCTVGGFLVIPSQSAVTQFQQLPDQFSNRFPISWFGSLQTLIASLQASTTANYPTYSYNLTAYASSSPYISDILPSGSILITNPTFIQNLAPDSTWSTIRYIIATILWIGFAYFVYHKARQLFAKTL